MNGRGSAWGDICDQNTVVRTRHIRSSMLGEKTKMCGFHVSDLETQVLSDLLDRSVPFSLPCVLSYCTLLFFFAFSVVDCPQHSGPVLNFHCVPFST